MTKRTKPTTTEAKPERAYTPHEILAPMRERARRNVANWQTTASKDPLRALEWLTREAVEAVTLLEALASCDKTIEAGVTPAALYRHALDMTARFARFPPASTGLLDATIAAYRAAAWSAIADELRFCQ